MTRAGNLRRRATRVAARTACLLNTKINKRAEAICKLPASILLLTVAVGLPFATFAAAFLVTDRKHPELWSRKGYFLSAAIDLPPASNFGSLGLTIALVAFAAVAVVRHHIVAERLRAADPAGTLTGLHSSSLAAALTAAVGGHGVAAYQHNQNHKWHNGFAAMFVLCALLHFHLESRVERTAVLSSRLARRTRATLVAVATIGCATFLSHVVIEEMSHTPIGIGKLNAAITEIISCACFVVYLATYSRSFHESRIIITVTVPPAEGPPPPPSPPWVGSHEASPPWVESHSSSSLHWSLPSPGQCEQPRPSPLHMRRCHSTDALCMSSALLPRSPGC